MHPRSEHPTDGISAFADMTTVTTRHQIPLYQWLGGPVRTTIRVALPLVLDAIDAASGECERALDIAQALGISAFAIRVSTPRVDDVVRTVGEVRRAVGPTATVSLRLSGQFTVAETRDLLPMLREAELLYVADPCALLADTLDAAYRELPALGLSANRYDRAALLACLAATPPAVLLIDPVLEGGPAAVRQMASIARVLQADISLVVARNDAALVRDCAELAAAMPACSLPIELPIGLTIDAARAAGIEHGVITVTTPATALPTTPTTALPTTPTTTPAIVTRPADATIRRVTLSRVKIPLRQLYVSSMYVMPDVTRTVIELETDDGRVGLGEAPGSDEIFQLASQVARSLLRQNPLERVRLQHAFASSVFNNRNGRNGWSAYGGMELALWDWAGHRFDLPACDLIGRRTRNAVDVVCPVPAMIIDAVVERRALPAMFRERHRIEAVVEYCRTQRRERGFRCFKYKSAGIDADWDVELMSALRVALGPDVSLRWDPNAAYSVAEASAICARMEHLGLEFYEDPTDDITGMASVRDRVKTPLATNMCVVQLDHLASAIRRRPSDVILADLYMWGGIENYLTMADTASAYGFDVAVHSLFETGIGTAANVHLAAALGHIRRANDCGLHVLAWDVIKAGPLQIEDGRMRVPEGPGWGVTLDRDVVDNQTVKRLVIEGGSAS